MNKLSFLLSIFLITSPLDSCCMFYDFGDDVNKFSTGYNNKSELSFLGSFPWDNGDSTTIICPNQANGYAVKELGGYVGRGYPCPFAIDIYSHPLSDTYGDPCYSHLQYEEENILESAPVTTLQFNVTLPSQLEKLVNVDCDYILVYYSNEEPYETLAILKPTYYLTISSENKYFYTKDGKLYNKDTNELITEFMYE